MNNIAERKIYIEQLHRGLEVVGFQTFPSPGEETFQHMPPFTVESVETVPMGYNVKGKDRNGAEEEMLILPGHKIIVKVKKGLRLRKTRGLAASFQDV